MLVVFWSPTGSKREGGSRPALSDRDQSSFKIYILIKSNLKIHDRLLRAICLIRNGLSIELKCEMLEITDFQLLLDNIYSIARSCLVIHLLFFLFLLLFLIYFLST